MLADSSLLQISLGTGKNLFTVSISNCRKSSFEPMNPVAQINTIFMMITFDSTTSRLPVLLAKTDKPVVS